MADYTRSKTSEFVDEHFFTPVKSIYSEFFSKSDNEIKNLEKKLI